jgi:hypothetical protein
VRCSGLGDDVKKHQVWLADIDGELRWVEAVRYGADSETVIKQAATIGEEGVIASASEAGG